ncbi:MAG TPA: molybdopterin molybdenumtransferase MoeA [Lachnospiraceae bacterium]|nr:molybdopterin molybdenumtransferase MoeA [Lachnospiraceae bacterium]
MLTVATIEESISIIEEKFKDIELGIEEIDIVNAYGKVIAEDIISDENVPSFNRSTVDGYAVRSRDTFGASEGVPSLFSVAGEVKMGEPAEMNVGYGEAVYVPTGGMVPSNADSVVMIEYVEAVALNEIMVVRPLAPLENMVIVGEDVKIGEIIFPKGHVVKPQDMGILAALGIVKLKVFREIRIGIISTGDEIVEPDADVRFGQIRNINSYALVGNCRKDGCTPKLYGIIKDDFSLLQKALKMASEENDIVLISGGSSVGTKDVTCDAINSLGEPGVLVHGLQIKPGKPTIIANVDNKAMFGLPGHPMAALIIYNVVVKELIYKLRKQTIKKFGIEAYFSQNYSSDHGREEYVMVGLQKKEDKYIAKPVYSKSALIVPMVRADGYVKIEANKEGILENEKVEIFLF